MAAKVKKLLLVNQSTGELCRDIANAFADAGYDVSVLTGKKLIPELNPTVRESVRLDGIVSYDKSSSIKRLLTWGLGFFNILLKVWFQYRDFELFLVSNPPFATLIPLFTGRKFSLLIYDIFPDILVTQKVLGDSSLLVRWWKKEHRKIFARAEHIFTIGSNMSRCLAQYIDESRITIIQNWTDTSFIKPVPKSENPFVKQQHLEDKFVVLYSGNIGNTHKVEVLLEAAKNLLDEPAVHFMIIGDGEKKKLLENMVREESLTNCTLLPYQPREILPYSLTCADIGVITLDESASSMSVPSKTYSMLAAGTAILGIASPETEFSKLVRQYDAGRCFASTQTDAVVDYIRCLLRDPVTLQQFKKNARRAAFDFTAENSKLYVRQFLHGEE